MGSGKGDFTAYGLEVNLASCIKSNDPMNRIMLPKSTKQPVAEIEAQKK
ncbi:MAG: hypothetical protein PHT37_00905 [Candidatus Cloacimonetes bacterium]|jgi:hypothetical protein|nr:hypothetical protein [Candidatus Cloacimonadota bacterium]MDD3562099.1 hypothetical protein [Candidatus Cloacimonadota bacterium]MDD4276436.1 hypothetical protein [Candidatus Cloacimonadota bacterium]